MEKEKNASTKFTKGLFQIADALCYPIFTLLLALFRLISIEKPIFLIVNFSFVNLFVIWRSLILVAQSPNSNIKGCPGHVARLNA